MQARNTPSLAQEASHVLNTLLLEAKQDPRWAERCISRALEILSQPKATSPAHTPGGLLPWRLTRVREAIEARLEGPLSSVDLAAAAGLSPSTFARAFETSHGMSPHQYLMRARIERAKTLMLTSSNALSDIALACGLADQSHFSRLFHKLEGVTPAAWHRRHRLA